MCIHMFMFMLLFFFCPHFGLCTCAVVGGVLKLGNVIFVWLNLSRYLTQSELFISARAEMYKITLQFLLKEYWLGVYFDYWWAV